MPEPKKIRARWTGPFIAEVEGQILHPGDEYEVHETNLNSAHWEPVEGKTTEKGKA